MKADDFVMYKNKGGGIESIGMKFNNLFRDDNLPAMIGGGIGTVSYTHLTLPTILLV